MHAIDFNNFSLRAEKKRSSGATRSSVKITTATCDDKNEPLDCIKFVALVFGDVHSEFTRFDDFTKGRSH